jgi:membrane-associated PAP2 superfamily phosphatase
MRESRYSPIIMLVGLSLFGLFNLAGVDFIWANILYNWQGGQWRLQHHWFTEQVMHQGLRSLNQLLTLLLVVYYLWQRLYRKQQDAAIHALGLLLLSLILCFVSIAVLKKLIPTECPWDLQQFGGTMPYIGLFSQRPVDMPNTQCFPAGHASIGFAWISLFFYYLRLKPAHAKFALIAALTLGFGLGLVQQLRGAHFFSHDIATALLCWVIAAVVFSKQALQPPIKSYWIQPTATVDSKPRSLL